MQNSSRCTVRRSRENSGRKSSGNSATVSFQRLKKELVLWENAAHEGIVGRGRWIATQNRDLNQPECAIVVMAKQPEPGKVKTRLCPPLTPGQAADLYEAFFLDTVSLVSGIEHTDVFVAYDPDTALDFFSRIMFSCQ